MSIAPLPDSIGPFRVLRPIGTGGMSQVFEVRDPSTGDALALKLLYQTGIAIKRFHREYEALTRLNHPSIVRVYHYGTHKGHPWLTMELLDGVALQVWVKQAGRPGTAARLEQVVRLGARVTDALQYIHDRGLIHRDLKSANVVVLADGRVKLLDFGTAHVVDAVERITRKGEFVGTFEYASPEQINGRPLDARSDLYSLGVLLYRLATGRRPFDSDDHRVLAEMHLKSVPRPPREIVSSLPSELDSLILALLAKHPSDRPQDAGSVARVLHALRSGGPDPARLVIRTDRAIGREDAHRTMLDRLAGNQRPTAWIVRGPRGAGRRRFVQGLSADLDAQGWTTRTIRLGKEGDAIEIVRALVHAAQQAEGASPEATSAVADLQQMTQRPGPVTETLRKGLVFGASRLAESLGATPHPSLIVLEDLGAATGPAIDVIAAVHRGLAARGGHDVCVLGIATDDPSGWWVAALPDATVCPLPPLDVVQVARAAGAMLHRRPPPLALARRLLQASGGQPRYLSEILSRMIEEERLVASPDGARVSWGEPDQPVAVSAMAAREIRGALARLPQDHRRVLEVLAVGFGPLPFELVAAASGFPAEVARHHLASLASAGWTTSFGASVEMAHPLAARLVAEAAHPCRRRVVERLLAATLPEREDHSVQEVRILFAGGRASDAAPSAVRRSRELEGAGRAAEAADLLDAVVAQIPAMRATQADLRAEIYLHHARCLLAVRPTDGGITSALALARSLGTRPELKVEAARLAARHEQIVGRVARSKSSLLDAWSRVEGLASPRLAERIAHDLGLLASGTGEPRSAREWCERARAVAQAAGDKVGSAHAEAALAQVVHRSGSLEEALTLARGAMAVLERAEDRPAAWGAASVAADALRLQGRFSDALTLIHRRLAPARDGQVSAAYLRLLLVAARCEADLHRLGSAQEMIDEIDANLRANEHLELQLEAALTRGHLLLGGGQSAEARAQLVEVHHRARGANLVSFAERARSLMAESLWALGEREEAGDVAEAAWLGLMGTGDLVALGDACTSWARAVGVRVDPQLIFQPVMEMINREGATLLHMELVLAQIQWARARRDEPGARGALREGRQLLNRLASRQEDTEQSALRVHPWARRLRDVTP